MMLHLCLAKSFLMPLKSQNFHLEPVSAGLARGVNIVQLSLWNWASLTQITVPFKLDQFCCSCGEEQVFNWRNVIKVRMVYSFAACTSAQIGFVSEHGVDPVGDSLDSTVRHVCSLGSIFNGRMEY